MSGNCCLGRVLPADKPLPWRGLCDLEIDESTGVTGLRVLTFGELLSNGCLTDLGREPLDVLQREGGRLSESQTYGRVDNGYARGSRQLWAWDPLS